MNAQNLNQIVVLRSTNEKGIAKTFIRITIDGINTECYLGYLVPKDHWDDDKKKCLKSYPQYKKVNKTLKQVRRELNAHFLVLSKKGTVTAEGLKRAYKGEPSLEEVTAQEIAEKKSKTLLNVTDAFISDFKEMVEAGLRSDGRLNHWKTNRSVICEFASFYFKSEDIPLHLIRADFAEKLYHYLTVKRKDFMNDDTHKRRKINLSEVTAKKRVKDIKQLIQLAENQSLIEKNPCKWFSTSGGELEVLPLELDEVERIYRKPMQIDRLEEVRDLFIFQCFTGFAYQEIRELTKENIVYVGIDREPWLMRARGKTNVNEMVPLLPIAVDILAKYENHPYCQINNKLLPVDTNTRYNGYLKEIGAICGIARELKTHLARHTFADIMLNVCDIPLEDVSKMLGHKSIRTTMKYCRVRKERIARNMKIAADRLFGTQSSFRLNSVA